MRELWLMVLALVFAGVALRVAMLRDKGYLEDQLWLVHSQQQDMLTRIEALEELAQAQASVIDALRALCETPVAPERPRPGGR